MSDWLRKDKDKVIRVNTSALVGLKAALFSKQKEFAKEKKSFSQNELASTREVSEKTSSIWKKAESSGRRDKSAGRGSKSYQQKEREERKLSHEEEAALERSRRSLEAKAALYDRLSKGEGLRELVEEEEEAGLGEGQHRYMVDFTKKAVESQVDSHSEETRREATCQVKEQEEEEKEEESREWVEYVDSLGRSRRCLKEDLEDMRRRDQEMRGGVSPASAGHQRSSRRSQTPEYPGVVEFGEERWASNRDDEEIDESASSRPVEQLHYQNVQGGEIRNHGVGYFAFSTDTEKRKEQMAMLNDLREKTFAQREKKQQLQEKRKALLEARLAKVKQRRMKKLKEQGLIGEGEDKEMDTTQDLADFDFDAAQSVTDKDPVGGSGGVASEVSSLLEEEFKRSQEKAKRDEEDRSERKRAAHVRPWDKGKVIDPVLKRKRELEDERLNEFAPPSSYAKLKGVQRQPFVRASNHDMPNQLVTPPEDPPTSSEVTSPIQTVESESQSESSSASGRISQVSSSASVPPPPPYYPIYGVPPPYVLGIPPQVGVVPHQVGVASFPVGTVPLPVGVVPLQMPPLPSQIVFPNTHYGVPPSFMAPPPPGYMMTTPSCAGSTANSEAPPSSSKPN